MCSRCSSTSRQHILPLKLILKNMLCGQGIPPSPCKQAPLNFNVLHICCVCSVSDVHGRNREVVLRVANKTASEICHHKRHFCVYKTMYITAPQFPTDNYLFDGHSRTTYMRVLGKHENIQLYEAKRAN